MSHCRAGLLAFLALSVLGVARAEAATLTVVNANDSGAGSLRDALANAATSGDTIAFAASLTGATITLTTSDPLCTPTTNTPAPFGPTALVVFGKDVTIDGSGAPGLAISGNNAQRIFAVTGLGGNGFNPPTTQGVLRLVNVTLTGGYAKGGDGASLSSSLINSGGAGGGGAGLGGAAFVDLGSRLSLAGCLVSACLARGGNGGGTTGLSPAGQGWGGGGLGGPGIGSSGGSPGAGPPSGLAGFGGGGGGGGVGGSGGVGGFGGGGGGGGGGNGGDGGNGGFGGGGGGGGGGVGVFSQGGHAGFGGGGGVSSGGSLGGGGGGGGGFGGGVFVDGGTLEATNTTITACTASAGIGGVGFQPQALGGAVFQRNGIVTLTFCTLAGNTCSASSGSGNEYGGALYVLGDANSPTLTVSSSILSNSSGAANDAVASMTGGGSLPAPAGDSNNVVVSQLGFSPAVGTIPANADPLLLPLAAHGGPTQTLALGAGSPAHDAGNATITKLAPPSGAGGVDQRGLPRRIGVTDVGAYETQPVDVSLLSGGGQTTTVGSGFGVALVFSATDPFGAGLNGFSVTLKPPTSGASASFLPAPLVTNASGLATATATANTNPGAYGVALVGSSTPFSLTNKVGSPASLSVVSGGGQKTRASTAFAQPIVLQVTDSVGNPLGGVALTLSPPSSGASASLSSTSLNTGSNGQVSVTATANATGGTYTVNANGPGISASFQLTNQVPASTPVLSGTGQSVAVGTAFGTPIVIQVSDASGNPIAGATVTLTAPTSGASATFSPASLITDVNGKISALATANGTAGGPYTVTITAGSVTSTFELTNLPSTSGSGGSSGSGGGSTGSGGGSHHSSGCVLGSGQESPGSLAPLLLALVGLVGRRRRASVES